jgi:hypothetical protein
MDILDALHEISLHIILISISVTIFKFFFVVSGDCHIPALGITVLRGQSDKNNNLTQERRRTIKRVPPNRLA